MEREFDAEEFLRDLERGAFDGHLQEEFEKLTYAQLEEIGMLMRARMREKEAD